MVIEESEEKAGLGRAQRRSTFEPAHGFLEISRIQCAAGVCYHPRRVSETKFFASEWMTRCRRAFEKLSARLSEKSPEHAESVAQFYILQIDAARVPEISEFRIAHLPVMLGQMAGSRAFPGRIRLLEAFDGLVRLRALPSVRSLNRQMPSSSRAVASPLAAALRSNCIAASAGLAASPAYWLDRSSCASFVWADAQPSLAANSYHRIRFCEFRALSASRGKTRCPISRQPPNDPVPQLCRATAARNAGSRPAPGLRPDRASQARIDSSHRPRALVG